MKTTQPDNLKLAIPAILTAVFALSIGDAVIKLISASFPITQIYIVRSVIAVALLLIVIKTTDSSLHLLPKALGWTVVRSLLLAFMWLVYYASLPHLKLSVAAAVYYTIPFFITLFSALFTGDKVGKQSWLAIVLGFAGVLIILRPDSSGFNYYAVLPLIAACFYAIAMVLTRTKCRQENPKVLSLALNITFIALGVIGVLIIALWMPDQATRNVNPFLFGEWTTLGLQQWLVLSVLGIVIVVGSLLSAVAYQNGPSSVIASFDYSYLGFSVLWGVILFSEKPDGLSIAGMIILAAAGLIAINASQKMCE